MSSVATCRITSGEVPPPPPDAFQTQLSAPASPGLGWPSTHTSNTINGPENEPATYEAALRSPQAREWEEAMCQEWQALIENHTFDAVGRNYRSRADQDQGSQ